MSSMDYSGPDRRRGGPDRRALDDVTRILVVDDANLVRRFYRDALERADFEVGEALNGVEALEKLLVESFDLVIVDVNMPQMDGLTLVRELRGLPTYRHTPLLVLTTEATPERKLEGREAGATGWIVKPFNPDKLLATVAKVLK